MLENPNTKGQRTCYKGRLHRELHLMFSFAWRQGACLLAPPVILSSIWGRGKVTSVFIIARPQRRFSREDTLSVFGDLSRKIPTTNG
jgi:hypothetical protein